MSRQGEARARTPKNVLEFWNREAQEWGDNPQVTIRDHYFRLLEIETISAIIAGKSKVLDIGCGTGFSTLFYSQHVEEIVGADPAVEMLVHAGRFLNDPAYFGQMMAKYGRDGSPRLRGNIRFEEGDILGLSYPDGSFDAVVAERVLINLPTPELQEQGIREVSRVLRNGGEWACVEVSVQGHQCVDKVREVFGLTKLEKYWHNLYIDEQHFERFFRQVGLAIMEKRKFETYQFLTKVVHPWVVRPEEPTFLSDFNYAARLVGRDYPTYESVLQAGLDRFFTEIFPFFLTRHAPAYLEKYRRMAPELLHIKTDFSGCSHQVLYVLRKRPQ